MGGEREALLASIEEVDKAFKDARNAFGKAASTYRAFARRIGQGKSVPEAFHGLEVPETRRWLMELLDRLEQARHETRTAIFAVGLAEGMSIGELSRLFGFSRQLAARFAQEARPGGAKTSPLSSRPPTAGTG